MTKYLGKKKLNYIHKTFKIGFIRIDFFKLRSKWSIRLAFEKGWN